MLLRSLRNSVQIILISGLISVFFISCSKTTNTKVIDSEATIAAEKKNSLDDIALIFHIAKEDIRAMYAMLFSESFIQSVSDGNLKSLLEKGRTALINNVEFDENEYDDTEINRLLFGMQHYMDKVNLAKKDHSKTYLEILADKEFAPEDHLSSKSIEIVREKMSVQLLSAHLLELGLNAEESRLLTDLFIQNLKPLYNIIASILESDGGLLAEYYNYDDMESLASKIESLIRKTPLTSPDKVELCSLMEAKRVYSYKMDINILKYELKLARINKSPDCYNYDINPAQRSSYCLYAQKIFVETQLGAASSDYYGFCENPVAETLDKGDIDSILIGMESFRKTIELHKQKDTNLFKMYFSNGTEDKK
ncbi:MAG: hypothetical protein V4596_09725 [Bdellovibrionota bacterium]